MKVCVLPSLLVCGLQATHLLRLFDHDLLPGYNNGQTDSGGNNVVTRQVILNKVKLVSF